MPYPRIILGLLAVTALLTTPSAQAQTSGTGTMPGMGGSTSTTTQYVNNQSNAAQNAPAAPDCDSNVSFLDSAAPQSQVRLIIDAFYNDRRPTRNEYIFPKSGAPGDPSWWVPEKRVDWQELKSYVEAAFASQMSVFFSVPTRFVNPDVNPNDWGVGDVNLGFKYAFVQTGGLALTGQLTGTIPMRTSTGLSSDHFSVEPAFLFYLRPIAWLAVEGEVKYWVPVTGTDFAGQLFDYGISLSFLERSYTDFWFCPVVELEAWTMINGKEMVVFPDGNSAVHSTAGETICNVDVGVRFGFGDNGDIYIGGGHSLTESAWAEYYWRVEFRVRF
jgi:hypothetical protein